MKHLQLSTFSTGFSAAILLAHTATADAVVNDHQVIIGSQCVGLDCTVGEFLGTAGSVVKIKDDFTGIIFEDTDVPAAGVGSDDWVIVANSPTDNGLYFANATSATTPVSILGQAPSDALVVSSNGNVGFGTSLPGKQLHVAGPNEAILRFEVAGGLNSVWEIGPSPFDFLLVDRTNFSAPFIVRAGARNGALTLNSTGYVGMGTETPTAPLEIATSASFNFFRITAFGATNDSVDITYTGGPLGTGQLRYNIVDGDNQEMSLDADGNMILDGTLTTSGPTCAGGCDRVFDADYALPSIQDHAAEMFDAGHLPAVGPTLPNAPVNMTEKMGNMLNELEHAHVYIAQLKAENNALRVELLAEIASLSARLKAVEEQ